MAPWPTEGRDRRPRAPPPASVRFLAGEDAAPSAYVVSVDIAEDGRSFDAELRAVSDAILRIDSLVVIESIDDEDVPLRVRAARWDDARLEGATLLVDGFEVDLLAADPEASVTLAPGATLALGLELQVASGAAGQTLDALNVLLDVLES